MFPFYHWKLTCGFYKIFFFPFLFFRSQQNLKAWYFLRMKSHTLIIFCLFNRPNLILKFSVPIEQSYFKSYFKKITVTVVKTLLSLGTYSFLYCISTQVLPFIQNHKVTSDTILHLEYTITECMIVYSILRVQSEHALFSISGNFWHSQVQSIFWQLHNILVHM